MGKGSGDAMNGDRRDRALAMVKDRIIEAFEAKTDLPVARQAVLDALNATRWVRAGRGEYREVPDFPIRLAAAKIVLEYLIGKPLVRSITATIDASPREITVESFINDLLEDKNAAESLIETIREHAALAEKARASQTIDVQALPEAPPKPSESQSEGSKR
jgi:hypothetical protein